MPLQVTRCHACGANMPVIVHLTASTNMISLGAPIRVAWYVESAERIWFEGKDEPVPAEGQEDIYLNSSTTLTLIAKGPAGHTREQLTFVLPPPKITAFEVNERWIDLNYPTIFSWEASNAETIFIEPEVGEVSGLSFCESRVQTPGQYRLRVKNASGEAQAIVSLALPHPEIERFQILQRHVEPGEPHLLQWVVHNTDDLRLFPLDLDVSDQTQIEVFPDRDTTYRLVAKNASGSVEREVSIPLPQPVIHDFSSPNPVSTEGKSITLSWNVAYSHRVEITPQIGVVPPSGSLTFIPSKAFTTFRIKATGHSGVSTSELTVSRFPLPLAELDEQNLFKELNQAVRTHEKMLRKQSDAQSPARFLSSDEEDLLSEEYLRKGSIGTEIRRLFGSFFRT